MTDTPTPTPRAQILAWYADGLITQTERDKWLAESTATPNPNRKLCVYDHATMHGDICTLAEFAAANVDDPDLVRDAECLARGFGFTIGGGAAPLVTISRWPDGIKD